MKGGIFTGPQIRVMLASRHLEQTMTVAEKNASQLFKMVVIYFLGNNKCKNYKEIVQYLIQHYEVECQQSCISCICILNILDQI